MVEVFGVELFDGAWLRCIHFLKANLIAIILGHEGYKYKDNYCVDRE
jgi:hypothetical protein